MPGLVGARVHVDRADEIGRALDPVPAEILGNAVDHLGPDQRVDEVRGADLHRGRAGDHEFEGVACVHDPPHPDHRDPDRLPALVDHAHGDRPDCRTAQSAHAV
jgi:hypothetical protein